MALPAQTHWIPDGSHPLSTVSGYVDIAYDSVRQRAVCVFNGTTYEHDGVAWRTVVTPHSPPHLYLTRMVFDKNRRRTVLFAGATSANPLVLSLDTWEYDGQDWTQKASNNAFSLPFGAAYHEGRGRVMAFGDGWPSVPTNDLWEWDGLVWHMVPTVNSPWTGANQQAIYYGPMTYDPIRDVLVMFGETAVVGSLSTYFPATWEWDATNGWVRRMIGGSGGSNSLIHYDRHRARQVLIAGDSQTLLVHERESTPQSQWVQRIASPTFGSSFFDEGRGAVVVARVVSSLQDAYLAVTPARFAPHGSGCPGTLGQATIGLTQDWTRAWIGETLQVVVHNLPLDVAVLATGFSDQSHLGTPLPFDLTSRGLPGCILRVAPADTRLVLGAANSAWVLLPVPIAPALLGQAFYQQALVMDPAVNPAGATISDSVRGTIGSK